jgi:hypothetical protein
MRARVVALSLRAAPAGGVELRLRASQPEQRPPRKHRRRSCVGSCFWFVWQLCLLGATTLGSVLIYDLSVQYGRQPLQGELTIQTARDHLLLLTSERSVVWRAVAREQAQLAAQEAERLYTEAVRRPARTQIRSDEPIAVSQLVCRASARADEPDVRRRRAGGLPGAVPCPLAGPQPARRARGGRRVRGGARGGLGGALGAARRRRVACRLHGRRDAGCVCEQCGGGAVGRVRGARRRVRRGGGGVRSGGRRRGRRGRRRHGRRGSSRGRGRGRLGRRASAI